MTFPERHIRVFPELRSKHVEDWQLSGAFEAIYFKRNYDLGSTPIPEGFRLVTLPKAIIILLKSKATLLEIPEPLWIRFFLANLLLTLAWRLNAVVSRTRKEVVTYAIENNDFSRLISGQGINFPWVTALSACVFRSFISRNVNRIAFGSEGSQALYLSLGLTSEVDTKLFEQLPPRPEPSDVEIQQSDFDTLGVIFVGRFEKRKGLFELMKAWPEVELMLPEARITLVGNGPLEELILEWCAVRPDRRSTLGKIEHRDVPAVMAANSVLLAPSIPEGRWKEQIGLPILEALQSGLTVVTTSDTGISNWLSQAGHTVLSPQNLEADLAISLVKSLEDPLDRATVLHSLPLSSAKLEAHLWLHGIVT
jgi:glycosyltransferase involved in cell wall biosynthesis